MRMRTPFRVVWAVSLLLCLVAVLLMPGMTTMVVRSHTSGKHLVRMAGGYPLVALAASIYGGLLPLPQIGASLANRMAHGAGPHPLDITGALRC